MECEAQNGFQEKGRVMNEEDNQTNWLVVAVLMFSVIAKADQLAIRE